MFVAVNADLLAWMPLDARRVLQLDRHDGELAKAHRRRNPLVDLSSTDGPVDVIVGEVPDGAGSPQAALAELDRLLTADGHLVICVPAISAWNAQALSRAGFRVLKASRQAGLPPRAVLVAEKMAAPPAQMIHVEMAAFAPRFLEVRTRLAAEQLQSAPELIIGYRERVLVPPIVPPGQPKFLVIQRLQPRSEAAWVTVLARAIRAGWMVVAEIDDHPDLIDRVHGRGQSPRRWLPLIGAHAVQTSTAALAESFRLQNPEVATFPNAAFSLPPFDGRKNVTTKVFYGALNREGFSGRVAEALGSAIAAHPETEFEVVHDRRFFDALPTTRKRFTVALDYSAYLSAIGACDIALLPLEGTPAELCKSDLKYVEAASRGAAVIASAAVYAGSVDDGRTGLIVPDVAGWAPALRRLLGDPELRQRIAHAAWEDVRDHRMFGAQVNARRDWYADLWARRRELESALLERLPALGAALDRDTR